MPPSTVKTTPFTGKRDHPLANVATSNRRFWTHCKSWKASREQEYRGRLPRARPDPSKVNLGKTSNNRRRGTHVTTKRNTATCVGRFLVLGDPLGHASADGAGQNADRKNENVRFIYRLIDFQESSRVESNTLPPELDGKGTRDTDNTSLGRGVSDVACGGNESLGRGDVDDTAAFGRLEEPREAGTDEASEGCEVER